MPPQIIFCCTLAILILLAIYLDIRFDLLKDISKLKKKKPYSFARVQLTWWTVIIIASFTSVLLSLGVAPSFHTSTLILLGISSATTAAASIIDRSDISKDSPNRCQDEESDSFLLDILSDDNGVSIHRFQTVAFNLIFGIWFICTVFYFLANVPSNINNIIPDISNNNLILLGISSGTYTALKTNENKAKPEDSSPNS